MVQVHVDLAVDPSREAEMLRYFETVFRPAATEFQGFVDVRMLKLRSAVVGSAPAGMRYRFAITYENEDLRQKWVASDAHQEVWGGIESALSSTDYVVLLFDVDR